MEWGSQKKARKEEKEKTFISNVWLCNVLLHLTFETDVDMEIEELEWHNVTFKWIHMAVYPFTDITHLMYYIFKITVLLSHPQTSSFYVLLNILVFFFIKKFLE